MVASSAEQIKVESRHLRGHLRDELTRPDEPFGAEGIAVLKFHGVYQQDDRDQRRRLAQAREQLSYSCMVRCSVPGGVLAPHQWLAMDGLASEVGDGTLRLTTRQGVQYHFVHKGELARLVRSLNEGLVTTYAACGDVVRNVMVSPAPVEGRDLDRLGSLARALAGRFRPRSAAYWELWLDGERAVSAGPASDAEAEPIYGDTYLPRKFKMGVAHPGDNSIDVFSQDLGIVLVPGADGRDGGVVLVGGGLGRSHADPTTYPRLAEPLGWAPDAELSEVAEAVVTAFRDFGDREDRSHARLKYVIEERGIDWFRAEVERRLGRPLADPVELPPWDTATSDLGWHRQPDGRWFLGLPVPSGRVSDEGRVQRRTAIRRIVAEHVSEVRVTPHQDILLCGIEAEMKGTVNALLRAHGVPRREDLSLTVLSSLACPALPTCGQALGEAERILPEVTDLLDVLLADRDLADLAVETRITGCPNGCARPYVAELGLVGRTKSTYDIWVGGDRAGTRLAEPVVEGVALRKLGDALAPLLDRFARERTVDESFGDWSHRVGRTELSGMLATFGRSTRSTAGATREDDE